jgi:hypothetical protein
MRPPRRPERGVATRAAPRTRWLPGPAAGGDERTERSARMRPGRRVLVRRTWSIPSLEATRSSLPSRMAVAPSGRTIAAGPMASALSRIAPARGALARNPARASEAQNFGALLTGTGRSSSRLSWTRSRRTSAAGAAADDVASARSPAGPASPTWSGTRNLSQQMRSRCRERVEKARRGEIL